MGCCSSKVSSSTQGYHINSVDLSHFDLLRSVGKGAFGKVRVVQHKASKKIYALKYINKEKCIQMKAVDNIIQERKLLEEIHNPFVW
jgi:serine/threonine kinase 32